MIADGPRANRPGEAEKCAATRAVIDGVDWDCEVQRNFAETNMGCGRRVYSGITWAFDLVDKAIIVEDDCMPSASFFEYCAELLDRYENDERIMMISGNNHLLGHAATADSYYFSRYAHLWGWATWRRAWAKHDPDMTHWPEIRDRKLFDQYLPTKTERDRWESAFQSAFDGNIDTWDYQWVYSIWANSGLCVAPARNLVRNIGMDHAEATHTQGETVYSSLGAEELELPLTHPATVLASSDKDQVDARLWAAHLTPLPYPVANAASAVKLLVRRATRHRRTGRGTGGLPPARLA
ncbi:methyltransferase type 11 [Mycobacterium sp. 852002-50816_SCH5313054-b]|nr:methyltransferase type 11 [Mycobacterium sp. 852002-50816_SCH5313054-b]